MGQPTFLLGSGLAVAETTRVRYRGTVSRLLGRRNLGGSAQSAAESGTWAMALLLSDSSLLCLSGLRNTSCSDLEQMLGPES